MSNSTPPNRLSRTPPDRRRAARCRQAWSAAAFICAVAVWLTGASANAGEPTLDELAETVRALEVTYRHQSQPRLQEQLLAAYNTYAIALAQAGQLEAGIGQLRRGLEVVPQQPQLQQNLAVLLTQRAAVLMEARKHREAQALLKEAVIYHERLAEAWALLGAIQYDAQRFAEAERAWKRALEINPSLPGIAERMNQLRTERTVEQPFRQLSQVYFDIRYAEGLPSNVEYQLREVLNDARRVIGQDLGHYPSQKITVLLYTPEQFRHLREQTPEWVVGQYDGKLRLPVTSDPQGAQFRQTVWHEYTHVIVHELGRGRCPTWLNEGLAEHESLHQGRKDAPRLRTALQASRTIPMAHLHEHFGNVNSAEEAALAYEQSLSLVTFLVERYGLWRVKRLLKGVGEGALPFEEAFFNEFHLRLSDLERRWLEWVRSRPL